MLVVEGLRKRYAEHDSVRGVSFRVHRGECFGLLGPNGAGKTTTLRCCLGLTNATSGCIELLNLPIPSRAREARARTGVMPQHDNLDHDFTVVEDLEVFGSYFGLPAQEARTRAKELLKRVGLTEKASAPIEALSGGMKRRLTLARALINRPEIVFLDEPTTGLDPQARHAVWDTLKSLASQGCTIVLTTHVMEEAQRLCDRVAIMDAGEVIAENAPLRLIEQEITSAVIEVHGPGVTDWLEGEGKKLSIRTELAGDTAFCYCEDAQPLMQTLQARTELRALRRGANLEDVFLKLTGRELRD